MKSEINRTSCAKKTPHNSLYVNLLHIFNAFKFQKKEKDFFCFIKLFPKDKDILDIGANIATHGGELWQISFLRNFFFTTKTQTF
ncbi:MAG: hypothetical protein GX140_07115 [Bacteroidales bacterium]|nr:hypothetical protein [Bacteroidales bacterium]